MKPATVTDEKLNLRAFPFSLKYSARDWLYYLPPASIDTWAKMKKAFLEKYFPASRASQLKKEISNTELRDCETMYEYLERFKKLCATCPYHGYTAQDLFMYFCGGLCMEDARTVSAACRGNIVNKSPPEAWTIIGELAESSRDFARKYTKRGVNSMGSCSSSSSNIKEKVNNLTSLFKDMMSGQRTTMVWGICSDAHPSEHCPLMQEGPQEKVNGVWESTSQKKWDPYSNTFNPGWKAYPNFRWGNSQNIQQFGQGGQSGQPKTQFIPRPPVQNLPPTQPPPSGQMSTEDMIRALVTSQATLQATVIQNQKENKASIQNIENQLRQMATTINRLEARDSNVLPSQTVVNPKNVSAVSLRNGRQLVEVEKPKAKSKSAILHEEEEIVVEKDESATPELVIKASILLNRYWRRMFHFLMYAKVLKELYTFKRQQRLKGAQKVKVSEHVSAMFQRKLPPKCGDLGMFTIPCTLGDTRIERAMLDLGASINVIPYSFYKSMKLGSLVETGIVIQLADRSNAYPKGVVEDVLVMVGTLIFPADFYVLEMEHDKHAAPILLGRPFLKTASTKIDASSGSLTMESDGQVIKFNIYDSMKYPLDMHSLNFIYIIKPCMQDMFNISGVDDVQMVIENNIEKDGVDIALSTNLQEVVADLSLYDRNPISYEKAPLTLPTEKLLPERSKILIRHSN
ncbi:uncharacterized protein LOC141632527 [Silene latifolia]|uniref:uncharacterized protein LOC141632527 n=1 Tax=Silene latifolia TaxID=37657 RepID=UPI003D76E6C2